MLVPKWVIALTAIVFLGLVTRVATLELTPPRYKYSVSEGRAFRYDLRTGRVWFTNGHGWEKL